MALTGSLSRMQVDHIDLFLMHWPKCRDGVDRKRCLQETWRYGFDDKIEGLFRI